MQIDLGLILKVWQFLNGRKTAIGLFLVAMSELSRALEAFGPETASAVTVVGFIITAVGTVHRMLKGPDVSGVSVSGGTPITVAPQETTPSQPVTAKAATPTSRLDEIRAKLKGPKL